MNHAICGLCKGDFPAGMRKNNNPLTDLQEDRRPLQHVVPRSGSLCEHLAHLRCFAKRLNESDKCSFCGTRIDLGDLFVWLWKSDQDAQLAPLSDQQKYRIAGIWEKVPYINKSCAPRSALQVAMEHGTEEVEPLLKARMGLKLPEDLDLYEDLARCFEDSMVEEGRYYLFEIFFRHITQNSSSPFAHSLLDRALKWSAIGKNEKVFTCLTRWTQFSSDGVYRALTGVICSMLECKVRLERIKGLCSIEVGLDPLDVEEVLNLLIETDGIMYANLMLEAFVDSGKIPEDLRMRRIRCYARMGRHQVLATLLKRGISEETRGESVVEVVRKNNQTAFTTLQILLDGKNNISPEARGRAIAASLPAPPSPYDSKITTLLARSGPFDNLYMEVAVKGASERGDWQLLSDLITPDLLEQVKNRKSETEYWAMALEMCADRGHLDIVELLCLNREFSVADIITALIHVCRKRVTANREKDLKLLIILLEKLPQGEKWLTPEVLGEACGRQDPYILEALLQHKVTHSEQWQEINESQWLQLVRRAFALQEREWLEESDAALILLLTQSAREITPAVRRAAITSAIEGKRVEALRILLEEGDEITAHVLYEYIRFAIHFPEPAILSLLLLAAKKRAPLDIDPQVKSAVLALFIGFHGYEENIRDLLIAPIPPELRSSALYWEKMLGPALKKAISNHYVEGVELLLQHGEMSRRMQRQFTRQAEQESPESLPALQKKVLMYQSKFEIVKTFFVDWLMRLLFFFGNLCS